MILQFHLVTDVAWTVDWRALLRDILVVVGWFVAVTLSFFLTGWPAWLYAVTVLGGVGCYSLVTGSWLVRSDG